MGISRWFLLVVVDAVAAAANTLLKTKDGQSPLSHAATTGSTPTVQLLLESGAADANDETTQGRPLLVHAIASGAEALAETLINAVFLDPPRPGDGVLAGRKQRSALLGTDGWIHESLLRVAVPGDLTSVIAQGVAGVGVVGCRT